MALRICLNRGQVGIIRGWSTTACRYSSSQSVDDFLHRSILPTDHFQKSMPRLGVPKLEETLHRYLDSQEAFLSSSEEFNKTKAAVEEFKTSVGPSLQADLEAFAKNNKHTSYITERWFDMYLKDRRPTVLTHNPVMFFNDSVRGPKYNQTPIRATNMIYSSIRMLRSLRENVLDPEMFHLNPNKTDNDSFRRKMKWFPQAISWYGAYLYKVFPLDQSQMKNLFNSTRIPEPEKDRIHCNPTARHFLVIHKGKHYIFDILNQTGGAVSPKQILSNILHILSQSDNKSQSVPGLGHLTTADRDTWTEARRHLLSLGNADNLELLDTAAYAFILDDVVCPDEESEVLHFLHGPGESRWFDKSFSVIMGPSGRAAVNMEHAWGDGVCVLRFFNEVWKDADNRPVVQPGDESSQSLPPPQVKMLEWKFDDKLTKEVLPQVKEAYDKKRFSLHYDFGMSDRVNKDNLKRAKLSPDSVMQLSFQMAHFKVRGGVAATYESCSTSAFKHGRTETVRSATAETRQFTRLAHKIGGVEPSKDEMWAALQACSKKHNKLTMEAAMGKGWDRHLFMLNHFNKLSNQPVPSIFSDPAYARINHIILSTSTLSSPALFRGCFAAVTPDGYGLGYGIREEGCGLGCTTWQSNSEEFIHAFLVGMDQIADVIDDHV